MPLVLDSAENGVWITYQLHGKPTNCMVDTGTGVTVISKEFWQKSGPKRKLRKTSMELVTANGEIIHCEGEVDVDFQLREFKGCFLVLLVNNFKFNCLIGNDLLHRANAAVDFRAKTMTLGGRVKVPFKRPIGNRKAIPETDVIVSVGTPIQIRALVDSEADGLPLLVEAQPVTGNDRIIAASAIVKVHRKKVTMELANATGKPVKLFAGAKLATLQLFIELNLLQDKRGKTGQSVNIFSEGLDIDHLDEEQKQKLLNVLEETGVVENGKHLGKTSLVEHAISTGRNPPVRQQPYHVPQVKRKIIEEEVQKILVSNVIRPSSSPWAKVA